jgi:GTP-binding protein
MTKNIRNVAIIAHVDHGKTTLIDSIMKQSGTFRDNQQISERVMDSQALEQERGITILAKPTSVNWKDTKINIIDTPGHSDFGGEVERILDMTNGVILLVDAAEGPMPQTKFVLSKALKQGLRPIVVINKIDKADARQDEVLNEVFDLFVTLEATDAQLDFPVLYASGRNGWCIKDLAKDPRENLHALLDLILEYVPAPDVDQTKPFAMLATLLTSDPYLGRCLVGRIVQGQARMNEAVKAMNIHGVQIETGRITKLFEFHGTERVVVEQAQAGDIICIAGLSLASVSDTICDPLVEKPIPATPIDPPTMSVTITVNDSPFGGTEGKLVTSTAIRTRLLAETETNVAITFQENERRDAFEIGGRGELQLGVLVETMRREGFELTVSRPHVVFKLDENGKKLEPIEEVIVDVDAEYSSVVIDGLNKRKGEMIDMRNSESGKTRLTFLVPSRALIGYQGKFMTDTRGTGILNHIYHSYAPHKGEVHARRNGALISLETGAATGFSIFNLQDRGMMFIKPQTKVYAGMIVGEHSRDNDLEINVCKGKQLSNMRASGSDESIILTPPKIMTLEQMMAYIKNDEVVEVTPESLRLRKKYLDPNERKRHAKQKDN